MMAGGLLRCHLQVLNSILRYQQAELELTFAPRSFHWPMLGTSLGLKNHKKT